MLQVEIDVKLKEHAARIAAAEEEERQRTLDPELFSSNAVSGHNASLEERVRGNRHYSQKGADSNNFLRK